MQYSGSCHIFVSTTTDTLTTKKTIIMNTYQEYKAKRKAIYLLVDNAEAHLKKVSKTNAGDLVKDEILKSPEYRKALLNFNLAFKDLQNFNKLAPKKYSRQYWKEKRNGLV